MDKPLFIVLIGIMYMLAGIALVTLAIGYIVIMAVVPGLVLDTLLTFIPNGVSIGDTTVTAPQAIVVIYFVLPMFFITAPVSFIGGYLLLTSDKKLAWILTIGASILYCLLLIGFIVDWYLLKDDIRELYTS